MAIIIAIFTGAVSPLTEGRGLKRVICADCGVEFVSPLTEGRGLKLREVCKRGI